MSCIIESKQVVAIDKNNESMVLLFVVNGVLLDEAN
jgi:hypothetical protein